MSARELRVAGAAETEAVGRRLAPGVQPGMRIYFRGVLGAGKTTLIRGILCGLGHTGAVKSPTYTLVEPYALAGLVVYHFDLYRLTHAEELEHIGIRDYLDGAGVCLVEWPERGEGLLPEPDVDVSISLENGSRMLRFQNHTETGAVLLARLR